MRVRYSLGPRPLTFRQRRCARRRGLRPSVAALLSLSAWLAGPLAVPAADYLATVGRFGDWTVTCVKGSAAGASSCAMEAPPRDLGNPAALLEIRVGTDGAPEISVDRFGNVAPDAPVYLRIDAGRPFRAEANAAGDVLWQGADADAVIAALSAGDILVIRAFTGDANRPTDAEIALVGFREAYRLFRDGGTAP